MKTWGDVYHHHLRKGEDHGTAAYYADKWEARKLLQTPIDPKAVILEKNNKIMAGTEEENDGRDV